MCYMFFFFSSRRRHTRCALVTGVQTCALPISSAVEARYSLEVTSDAAAGKNRSTQRGTARLQPGTRVILITMTLGNVSHGNWSAKLLVEPSTREPYQQIRRSEESRVGKECVSTCRYRWAPYHTKKNMNNRSRAVCTASSRK